jgi:futalosine hydrolase
VVAAVLAERDALVAGAEASGASFSSGTAGPYFVSCSDRLDVLAGGVGPAAAAAATATALSLRPPYDLVLSVGIGGAFAGRADVGQIVVATEIRAADLGAETDDGFLSVDDLGFGSSAVPATTPALPGLDPHRGTILTVSTVTGSARRADELAARHDPVAEAMEGFGVADAARAAGTPVGEIRAVSNRVGRRNRADWDIPAALAALRDAGAALEIGTR